MRKAKTEERYFKIWGKKKPLKEPSPRDIEATFRYKCDKLSKEIDDRLRASAKVYTKECFSQEFLRTLVSPKSL